jgi:hypothetical protein
VLEAQGALLELLAMLQMVVILFFQQLLLLVVVAVKHQAMKQGLVVDQAVVVGIVEQVELEQQVKAMMAALVQQPFHTKLAVAVLAQLVLLPFLVQEHQAQVVLVQLHLLVAHL